MPAPGARARTGRAGPVATAEKPPLNRDAQTDFDGLELNIQGHSTVSGCLSGLLAPETLEGDNQYACERCAVRRDAQRSIRLRSLPPVLSIQVRDPPPEPLPGRGGGRGERVGSSSLSRL